MSTTLINISETTQDRTQVHLKDSSIFSISELSSKKNTGETNLKVPGLKTTKENNKGLTKGESS